MNPMKPASATLILALASVTFAGVAMEGDAMSRSCIASSPTAMGTTALAVVTGTFGFVLPAGCPSPPGPYHISTAPPCPAVVGPQPGEYCGPVIPPFSKAVCTWLPVVNTVPTGLYAGFDYNGDGNVFFPSGEQVQGPIPPFPAAGVIANPTPFPGRIIAYTTNLASQAPAPADTNLVFCA